MASESAGSECEFENTSLCDLYSSRLSRLLRDLKWKTKHVAVSIVRANLNVFCRLLLVEINPDQKGKRCTACNSSHNRIPLRLTAVFLLSSAACTQF